MTLIRQLEARLNGLDTLRAKTVAAKGSAQTERKRARRVIGTPFKHADALEQTRAQLSADSTQSPEAVAEPASAPALHTIAARRQVGGTCSALLAPRPHVGRWRLTFIPKERTHTCL
jgi:hypothetical protein